MPTVADPNDYEAVANPNDYEVVAQPAPVDQKSLYDALLPAPAPETPQTPSIGEIAKTAGEAAIETAKSFIPRSLEQALGLATPVVGAVEDIGKAGRSLTDTLFGGKSVNESAAANYPEAQILSQAEKTPPYSKERFEAGFGVLAQLGMGAGIVRGFTPKPTLTESLFGEQPSPVSEHTEATTAQPLTEVPTPAAETPTTVSETTATRQAEPIVSEATPRQVSTKALQENIVPESRAIPRSTSLDDTRVSPDATLQPPAPIAEGATPQTVERLPTYEERLTAGSMGFKPLETEQEPVAVAPRKYKDLSPPGQLDRRITNAQEMVGMLEDSSKWETHPATGAKVSAEDRAVSQKLLDSWKQKLEELQTQKEASPVSEGGAGTQAFTSKPYLVLKEPVSQTSRQGQAATIDQPLLTRANRTDSSIRLSFDAKGKIPTADEIKQQFADRGHAVSVTKFKTNLVSATKGEVNYQVDVFDNKARMSSDLASKAMSDVFGKDEPFRSETQFEQAYPLQQRFGAAHEYGLREMVGAQPKTSPVSEAGVALSAPVSKEASGVAPTEAGQPEPPISTKNAYTEAQRAARGFPEAEQVAKRDFGTVWDEAKTQAEKDPSIGRRLVNELNQKPRTISDTENAHLLRTEIAAQTEHSAAVEAVNSAKTPEDLTAAKSRLELARQDLQDVYDATKRAGTKSGQALASRQMLAKEDYTLAAMEARRRAANDGAPLNEKQLGEVSELHKKIADLQSQLDAHEVAQRFNTEFSRLVNETRKEAKASRATTKFSDFMDRKADEARARIVERRGRLTTGFDPSMIADEAIVGASHIAKGITKFADWSVKMVDEFGDAVRPFLKDIWDKARTFHAETGKEYGEKALARYKNYLSKQTEQIQGKLQAGDFTKAERQRTQLDAEAFTMRANLQKLKNQFERGVAKEAYNKKSSAQKFWDHFVGVERAMKLSGPEVFGKLGVAAFTREALAPVESAGGYATSKLFPRLAAGTKYGADLPTVIRAEIKAKAAMFTKGMADAAQNVLGKETQLDAISGNKIRPDFWYNRIGQMHAAIKAPVKRAEFTRSLEQRMSAAVKSGEDIHHPEVMTRLANEAVMDANRAIFQQKTVVSSFFSMLDKQVPVAGRTARFLFPVVKIPINLFKELVTYHAGAPVAATKIGMAYWKGVETLPPIQREAIIRQFTKGSIGGAALLWGYFNSDQVRKFFDNVPQWFGHTPMAMVLNEGSYLKKLQGTDPEKKEGAKELAYMAKTDIPFMYSVKSVTDALDTHNSHALTGWINNMVQSTVVPQISTQVAKAIDKPGSFPSNIPEKTVYRPANNPIEAVKLGIPVVRQTVAAKTTKPRGSGHSKQQSGQSIPAGKTP